MTVGDYTLAAKRLAAFLRTLKTLILIQLKRQPQMSFKNLGDYWRFRQTLVVQLLLKVLRQFALRRKIVKSLRRKNCLKVRKTSSWRYRERITLIFLRIDMDASRIPRKYFLSTFVYLS